MASDKPGPRDLRRAIQRVAAAEDRIEKALDLISRYGGIDEVHHMAWVLDQVTRILAGRDYAEVVRKARSGAEGPETYDWNEGP